MTKTKDEILKKYGVSSGGAASAPAVNTAAKTGAATTKTKDEILKKYGVSSGGSKTAQTTTVPRETGVSAHEKYGRINDQNAEDFEAWVYGQSVKNNWTDAQLADALGGTLKAAAAERVAATAPKASVATATRAPTVTATRQTGRNGARTVTRTDRGALLRAASEPTERKPRVRDAVSGAVKQYAGSASNAAGMFAEAVGGTAMSDVYKDQTEMLERQIAALQNRLADKTLTEKDRADAEASLKTALERRAIYGDALRSGENTAKSVYQVSDTLQQRGAADIERAKEGLGKVGRVGIDLLSQGAQFGADLAIGAATGGGTLGAMALRSFGGGGQEARQAGANLARQFGYGAASAAVEVLTEKMFDGLAGVYGKGAADEIVAKLINRVAKNDTAKAALKVAADAAGESVEEMVSGLVNPLLKTIYNGQSVGQNYSKLELADVGYDMLIGGLMGAVVGSVGAASDIAHGRFDAGAAQKENGGNFTPANENAVTGQETPLNATQEKTATQSAAGEYRIDAPADIKTGVSAESGNTGAAGTSNSASTVTPAAAEVNLQNRGAAEVEADQTRVQRGAATLGLSGSRALSALYQGAVAEQYDAGQVMEWFTRAYFDEMNGTEYTGDAPEIVRTTAEAAAKNDLQRTEQAKYFGERAGLSRDPEQIRMRRQAGWSSKTTRSMDALGKALGVEIQVARSLTNNNGDGANAKYVGGVLTLSMRATDPLNVSAVHEAVHRIRETSPDAYSRMAAFVLDHMSDEGIRREFGERADRYRSDDVDLLTEETIADAFGRVLENSDLMNDLAKTDRSLLQMLKDTIADILAAVRRALNGQNVKLTAEQKASFAELENHMTAMQRLFEDTLRTIPQSETAESGGEAKYSLKDDEQNSEGRELTPREQLDEYAEQYGAYEKGEKATRDFVLPRRTAQGNRVSQTVRTIAEAGATPDILIPNIETLAAKDEFTYTPYSDKDAIANATKTITKDGWEHSLEKWKKNVKAGKTSKDNVALGWALYNNAANSGNTQVALDILDLMVGAQRNAAQAVQATRILKQLSPEAQLYGAFQSVKRLQEQINNAYGSKDVKLKVDEGLAEALLQTKSQETRDTILKDIYRDVGKQMPSNWLDRWNAWRYLAMLANPRTHIRNIAGNLFFAPVVAAKDITATAIESAAYHLSGGKIARTKSTITPALWKAAYADYANVREQALGEGKYNDYGINVNRYVEEGRRIFGNTKSKAWNKTGGRALEAIRRANSYALDLEDVWFSRPHYAFAMAQYCKANGINPTQINKGIDLADARAYAIKEAQKATYRDANDFSKLVSSLGRGARMSNNNAARAGGVIVEGVLPFRKTPANILARGVEYSPLGILKSITYDVAKVKNGDMTPAQMMDNLAAGLTGTELVALGVFLAAQGLVRGHGGDDEDKEKFDKLQGHQNYSLEIDNQSVTLDWLAPEALSFFVGVNLWEQTAAKNEDVTPAAMLNAIGYVGEPLINMSCLQSLNDLFDSVGYAKDEGLSGLTNAVVSAATSYLTQAQPTIFGQLERIGEDKRYTTYTGKDSGLTGDMQYTIGRASARTPVWEYRQIPYIDAWGREEATGALGSRIGNNMFNPAYLSTVQSGTVENEIERLYDATDETGVFPKRADKYIKVDGERKDLTPEEYVKYAKSKGATSYALVSELIANSGYAALPDKDKADMVSKVYDYANQTAKAEISKYQVQSWVAKAQQANVKYKIPVSTYILVSDKASDIEGIKDKDGNTIPNSASLRKMQAIYDTKGLTDRQRQAMFAYVGVGSSVIGYSKDKVDKELKKVEKRASK